MKSLLIIATLLLSLTSHASTSSRNEIMKQLVISEEYRNEINSKFGYKLEMTDLQRELAQMPADRDEALEKIIIIKLAMHARIFPKAAQKLFLKSFQINESISDEKFVEALDSLKARIQKTSFPLAREKGYFIPGAACMVLFR